MHISQKSFLPSFLYDLPVGHDKPLHASLYQTESFQDNANYDKFHHPALCAFLLISLIRENRGGSRCFSWGACCLIEWCWNCNPQPPVLSPFRAVTTSSLLSFHIFPLFEAASLSLAGNGSTNLTWAQKNHVNVKIRKSVCVCECVMYEGHDFSVKCLFCIRPCECQKQVSLQPSDMKLLVQRGKSSASTFKASS